MNVHNLPSLPSRVLEEAKRSPPLSNSYYTDPAIFDWEKEHIFFRSWIYAGHVSQVAEIGDVLPCRVLDEPLLIIRNTRGELNAFYNVCAHRGMRLVDAPCNRKNLQCPYHAWIYDLDGDLLRSRRTDHLSDFPRTPVHLKRVAIEVVESLIFVNLDEDAAPMSATIGPMFEDIRRFGIDVGELTVAATQTYEVNANWKVVIDNFLESYHAEVAHPEYTAYAAFDEAFVEAHDWYTLMGGPSTEESLESLRSAGRLQVTENRYHWGFPTFAYLFYSGPPNLFVWEFIPLTFDRTLFRRNVLMPPGESIDKQSDALDDQLTREDINLIEGVWAGLQSRGLEGQGHYVINDHETQRSETAVHRFHRQLQHLYGDSTAG